MQRETLKGYIYGIVAAVCYGTNPLGALPLYAMGVNTTSVLFYRFSLAALLLGVLLVAERKSLRLTRHEAWVLLALGLLFAVSSVTYYLSFRFMDAGLACTILFVYPVMVAVLMAVFFGERVRAATVLSIVLALAGIGLLYRGPGGAVLSTAGIVLVLISAFTYALYIIVVNKSRVVMSSMKLTFYVLLVCMALIGLYSLTAPELRLMVPPSAAAWGWGLWLALVPTVVSLVMMAKSVHAVGSTPTAIMGALEPLTAVVIGITVFGEAFTARLGLGIALILLSVLLIIAGRSVSLGGVTHALHGLSRQVAKVWRWK